MNTKGQNIQVFVRCRPLNAHERVSVVEVTPEKHEVRISDRRYNDTKNFYFDQVFGSQAEQIDVYRTVVKPLIDQVLLGFNCTVFAYGQTGTGKTFTMEGDRSSEELDWENDPHSGMIPRAISQLFDTLKDYEGDFSVRVSFIELYNEDTYDLLSAIDDTTKLRIFEDTQKKGSVIVGSLEEVVVQSKTEIYEILKRGSAKRQTAATLMNACSSRSHTIFTVTVHIKEGSIEGEDVVKIGKLNLVDLAGSENIGRSGAMDKRAREAGNINQSLLTLGRVITALVEKRPHIPYRESKLTRLLQDSLGGKTKTSIIATVSPASIDVEDTLSTLDYASRAKKITNKPEMNQRLTKKALLREYTQEIERLRKDLQATREKNGIFMEEENYKEMCKRLAAGDTAVKDKEDRLTAIQIELERQRKVFDDFTLQYERTKAELDKTKERCQKQKKIILDQKHEQGKLVCHATEVMHVAERATNDNYLLHGKKERIENILKENRTSIDKYRPILNDDITRIESVFEMFAQQFCDEIDSFKDKLDKNAITKKKLVTYIAKAIKLQVLNLESESATNLKLMEDLRSQSDRCTRQAIQLETMAQESRTQSTELLARVDSISKQEQDLKNQADALKKCESVLDHINENLSAMGDTDFESIKGVVSSMKSTGKRECASLRQETETLLTRELKEDIKTGLTPQKKTYDIPERIVMPTSLCDSILEDSEECAPTELMSEHSLVASPTT